MNEQDQIEHALALDAKIRRLVELEYTCRTRNLHRLRRMAVVAMGVAESELEEFNHLAATTLLPK